MDAWVKFRAAQGDIFLAQMIRPLSQTGIGRPRHVDLALQAAAQAPFTLQRRGQRAIGVAHLPGLGHCGIQGG